MKRNTNSHRRLTNEVAAPHQSRKLADPESKTDADALHHLGILRLQQGDAKAAAELIERATSLCPDAAEMFVNLGTAYRAQKKPAKAAQACRKALSLNSNLAVAFFNLGHSLQDLGNLDDAVTAYKSYLMANPQDSKAYLVLADTYRTLNRHHEAIDAYESALLYDPGCIGATANTATILRDLGWPHAASAVIDDTLALAPLDHDIRRTRGVISLLLGELQKGWAGLESRFHTSSEQIFLRDIPPAYWDGEDLTGQSVLIWTEQGLGDEILHGSILPDVIRRAGQCVIECSKRMVPVFARSFPAIRVVGYKASNIPATSTEGIDYQIPLASLGQHFRSDFASFPRHDGYLKADPDKAAELRARYEALAGGRRIVGISWRSNNEFSGEAKSTALTDMAPLLQASGVMFVNLQYGDCTDELMQVREQLNVEVIQDPAVDPLVDMDMFFAQVAALDLVLSTSNTTAHVAGSQNIPVWVLLPHGKGVAWYWFLRRADSPWYPSARLIRADHKLEPGQARWLELAERTATELTSWAAPSPVGG